MRNFNIKTFLLTVSFLLLFFAQSCSFGFDDTLKFVQLSDTHLSDRVVDTSYKQLSSSKSLLEDAILQICNINDLDFVMLTGDATDKPDEKSVREFINGMNFLNVPWYMAFGNHDIAISGPLTKEKYVSILNSSSPYFNFEKSYYSFEPKKSFKVIVLDGVIDDALTANGRISDEQLQWLDDELKNSKNKVVLIFLHFPLLEPYSSYHHKILNADEFYKVLDSYKQPIAIFSGHYHTTKITKERNILHVSSPSLVSYPNAFRVVSVTNYKKKIIFDFYWKETNLKDVQNRARLFSLASSTYEGGDEDKSYTFVMEK